MTQCVCNATASNWGLSWIISTAGTGRCSRTFMILGPLRDNLMRFSPSIIVCSPGLYQHNVALLRLGIWIWKYQICRLKGKGECRDDNEAWSLTIYMQRFIIGWKILRGYSWNRYLAQVDTTSAEIVMNSVCIFNIWMFRLPASGPSSIGCRTHGMIISQVLGRALKRTMRTRTGAHQCDLIQFSAPVRWRCCFVKNTSFFARGARFLIDGEIRW